MNFVLDISTWRSGGSYNPNMLGEGTTNLLNDLGYMCCLGQFSCQLGVDKQIIIGLITPVSIFLFKGIELPVFLDGTNNNELAAVAMGINDREATTPDEKVIQLQRLFWKHGHTITTLNRHLI